MIRKYYKTKQNYLFLAILMMQPGA